jgi:hypothetical protein
MSLLILVVDDEPFGTGSKTMVAKSGLHEIQRLPSMGEPTRLARTKGSADLDHLGAFES